MIIIINNYDLKLLIKTRITMLFIIYTSNSKQYHCEIYIPDCFSNKIERSISRSSLYEKFFFGSLEYM